MQKSEALRLLEVKLAAIEQDRETELDAGREPREEIDARAEARALTAILDFLENCKLKPSPSLLRLFRRYLHGARRPAPVASPRQMPRSRAG